MNELESIWVAGIDVCAIKGYKFTATCMAHALYGGGSQLTCYNDSDILNEIRKSKEYKGAIQYIKEEYKKSGKKNFPNVQIDFTHAEIRDLYFSLQHVLMDAEVQDTGNLFIKIHDTYDFDQVRTFSKGISVGNLGNDLGYFLQHWTDIIKSFDILIEGYEWVGKRNDSSGGSSSGHSGSGSLGKSRIEKFVDIAESQIGYTEKYNNITKYGAWYGMQDEWCAMFVSWCANEAGILGSVVPMYAYCPYGANWYIRKGLYRRRDSGYKPRRGDVIFFQKDGTICHTGIVTGYENGTVYTVEGNASNRVKRNSHSLSNSYVSGFGVSDPSASGISISGSTLLRRGSRGYSVERLQKLLIGAGYSVGSYGADGVFGEGTYDAVIKFQRDHGLSQDGIVGPNTWNALLNNNVGSSYGLLKKGSRGDSVRSLQESLISHGYSVGSYGADGVFGEGTYDAVIKFQRDHGLSQDGIVGPNTWNALKNSIGNGSGLLKKGSKGESVKKLQNLLISHGYSVGSYGADGSFGEGTYDAVIKFQRDHGLSQDGVVGPATWNALSNGGISVLRKGDKGNLVKKLQESLISHGYSVGSYGADGSFGEGTYNAVIKFQRDHGLSQDGIVGIATWNALSSSIGDGSTLLRKGSKGEAVRNLQESLISHGYSVGSYGADGSFGEGTYNAVIKFQKEHGLSQDGIVGPATWRALNNSVNNGSGLLRKGSRGDSVRRLQELLISHGYSVGNYGADGVFGEGTYNAVIKFQRDHGLSQDGVVGPATWNAL